MRLIPYFNTDELGGGTASFEVNGQQMTAEQVVESYKKLQGEYTKVTQNNSEMKKQVDSVKGWVDFDQALEQLSQEKGINAKALAGQQLDGLIQNLAQGKAPTSTQINQLDKAIDKAESKGDDATVKKLEALESVVMEQEFEKNLSEIEKEAIGDGITFNRNEFLEFADEWLEDMGIGDEDEFDLKLLKKVYQAYEAKQLKEQSKQGRIPPLGTSGGAGAPGKQNQTGKVGGLKGAYEQAQKMLSGS